MWKRILCCGLVMLMATSAAWAQVDLESDPGYVNLEQFEAWFDEEASIIVNIKGALLNLVAEASRFEDPELADMLRKLKAVQVRGYDLDWAAAREVERRANGFAKTLEAKGWDIVVRVRDDEEHVHVYVRVNDEVIAGMMVMVISSDDGETYFLNIVGDINPEQIGRIGRKFDIEPLDDMKFDY